VCGPTSLANIGLFLGLTCCLGLGQATSAAERDPVSKSAVPLVDKMGRAQAENRPQASYREVLKYRIFPSNNLNSASEILAEVDFQPPGTKRYAIQKTSGSRRAEQVVRSILDHEVEASAQGRDVPSAAVMKDKYDVTYLGESVLEDHPCYRLALSPKRKEKNLISGEAWVDKRTFLVRQIDGELVKTPSWWLKKVHVKIVFGFVGGTWLQTSTEAMADIRIFGNHTLTAEIVDFRKTGVVAKAGAAIHNQ
jgi:hypothetical protein